MEELTLAKAYAVVDKTSIEWQKDDVPGPRGYGLYLFVSLERGKCERHIAATRGGHALHNVEIHEIRVLTNGTDFMVFHAAPLDTAVRERVPF